ncbi:MAG TPA: sulfatase-like hydrolase/transferase [Thermoanaerobaculia bacterium]|nr:sulfatase-like hydrolase/transferase [Thermoanaerobaculia bacterium]
MKRTVILFLLIAAACARRNAGTYPNAPVIIISIDTLRADHLPMFGYRGVETPSLDAFRKDAVLFTSAYSHVPLTLPSHVSILTGLLPPRNGVRNNIGYVLDPKVATIPSFLKQHGYESGAAVSAFVLRGSSGLARSFDYYEDAIANRPDVAVGALQRPGRVTAEIAEQWIAPRASQPFFFFFHIFEPHAPYEPDPMLRSRYGNSYDGEIATADAVVGGFLNELKRRRIYDRAVIFILSDHGEGLDQHGEAEHGIFVYREDIHVPLLVKLPGKAAAGTTVDRPVALVDVFPTIAQLLGFTPPAGLSGRSLFAQETGDRRIYSESLYPRIHLGWSELRSLVDSRSHFIQAPKPELYDMRSDPAETKNLVSEERRTYGQMRQELGAYIDSAALPVHVDPEEAKKLAALGYLSSTASSAGGNLPDPKDRIGEIAAMMKAAQLLHDRRYDEAIAAFRKIVDENPHFTDAWNELGTSLESAGRYEDAIAAYRKAIATTPELAGEFGLKIGSALLHLERYDEAEGHARLGEKSNPAATHLLLARIALARKDFPRAEEEAKRGAADATMRVGAEILLAQIYAQQGRVNDAMPVITRVGEAIEREKLGAIESYHFTRGDILARMNRYDEAIAEFRQEIALFPANRQTYANLYLIDRLLGRQREADQALADMMRAVPGPATKEFAAKTARALGKL